MSQVVEFFGGEKNGQQHLLHDLNTDNPLVSVGLELTVNSVPVVRVPGQDPRRFLRLVENRRPQINHEEPTVRGPPVPPLSRLWPDREQRGS